MKYYKYITIIYICLLLPVALYADYEDLGCGARAAGMADAFVGLADDIYALSYNPSGISLIGRKTLAMSYNKLHWGFDDKSQLNDSFAGYVHPILSVPKWLQKRFLGVTDWGALGVGIKYFKADTLYAENAFMLAYAKPFSSRLSAGMNLKILSKSYGSTLYTENSIDFSGSTYGVDPVFASGYSKTNVAFDVASHYKFDRGFSMGLVLKNLNQPNTGLKDVNKLPLQINTGLCYSFKNNNILLDAEHKENESLISSGFESWLMKKRFALRAGLQIGSRSLFNICCGLSYNLKKNFRFDYAAALPQGGIKNTMGSHRISIVMFFGKDVKEQKKTKTINDNLREAQSLYIKKQYNKAIKLLDKVLNIDPKNNDASILKKEIKARRKESTKSKVEKHYTKGLQYFANKKYNEAIAEWKKCLKLNPKHKDAKDYISRAKKAMKPKRAAEDIKVSVSEADKKKAEEHYNKALILYSNGKLKESINELKTALKYNPNHKGAKEALNRIQAELKNK